MILDVKIIETYIAPEDKEMPNFTYLFNIFINRRIFFDSGIKNENPDKSFNVSRRRLKLFLKNFTVDEEFVEELLRGNALYSYHYRQVTLHLSLSNNILCIFVGGSFI